MILLYVQSTPRIYNLLLAELNDAREKGHISRPIQDYESKRLPYLQAVIREGLRVFPALTPLLNKTVPKGGDCVAGFHLPTGTEVGVDVVSHSTSAGSPILFFSRFPSQEALQETDIVWKRK